MDESDGRHPDIESRGEALDLDVLLDPSLVWMLDAETVASGEDPGNVEFARGIGFERSLWVRSREGHLRSGHRCAVRIDDAAFDRNAVPRQDEFNPFAPVSSGSPPAYDLVLTLFRDLDLEPSWFQGLEDEPAFGIGDSGACLVGILAGWKCASDDASSAAPAFEIGPDLHSGGRITALVDHAAGNAGGRVQTKFDGLILERKQKLFLFVDPARGAERDLAREKARSGPGPENGHLSAPSARTPVRGHLRRTLVRSS